ncbi:hypothetical protein FRC03_000839 [Tulasnella sp. 419]|nr:hypothetical protein FRC03_000839 [Tulasnella sp. 419]
MLSSSILVFLALITVTSAVPRIYCPDDQDVYIEDTAVQAWSGKTVIGNWWWPTKYRATLYAAGRETCEYKLDGEGGKYHGKVAIAKARYASEDVPLDKLKDRHLEELRATYLKHDSTGALKWINYRWAVSDVDAEGRKAQFVDFSLTTSWQNLLRSDYADFSRCRSIIRHAGLTLEQANELLSRTGTSIPNQVYFGAVLFTPNGKLVRIRDEYLTDGEPSDRRWSYNNVVNNSEYPLYSVCDMDPFRQNFSSDKSGGS